jgi:hypothetical protein
MTERHRWIVDRHEGDRTVVEVDGHGLYDVPRSILPPATRGDDVLAVIVDADQDQAVITVVRDTDATAQARTVARAAIERLSRRDPGGDIEL